MTKRISKVFHLPDRVPVSSIYIDESGTRNSSGGFFVIGFLKVRDHQPLERDIRHLRQKHQYFQEIHFADIRKNSLEFYFDVVETLAAADIRVGGSVYDSVSAFQPNEETWKQQAAMATLLTMGNINKGEVVNVFLDLVQTPKNVTLAQTVRDEVNRRRGGRCVAEAYDLDSRASDFLQLADLIASSIAYERRHGQPDIGERRTPKARVAARLRRALETDGFHAKRRYKLRSPKGIGLVTHHPEGRL